MTISPQRCTILALHRQVNVIKPEGFFGPILSESVARSGVVARAVRFHGAARAAGVPVVFTRFTVPVGEGDLVRNTEFMKATDLSLIVHPANDCVAAALTTAGCLTAGEVHALLR